MLGGFVLFAVHTASAVQFQISDAAEFSKIIDTNVVFTTHYTNPNVNNLMEGPVWIPNGQYLIFSDVGANKLKKLDPSNNTISDYLSPPANAKFNGNILDLRERLISCECGSGGFQVVMTTNGVIVPLVTSCGGLKFLSPNDVLRQIRRLHLVYRYGIRQRHCPGHIRVSTWLLCVSLLRNQRQCDGVAGDYKWPAEAQRHLLFAR